MSEWQTIETAPTDGAEVLVYVPKDQYSVPGGYIQKGTFTNGFWRVVDEQTGGWHQMAPTHWMPIREPPK